MYIFIESKKILKVFFVLTVIIVALFIFYFAKKNQPVSTTPSEKKYLVIVIDDFGNNSEATEDFMHSTYSFTPAIMPLMPNSTEESNFFSNTDKDIILHQPMEAKKGKTSWLGPGAILHSMSDEEVRKTLEANINSMEGITGINNHMGSKVMENERIVRIMLNICSEKNLFFLDSKTTSKSLPQKLGAELNVKVYSRDVFLDSTDSIKEIEKNIDTAIKIANKKGYAIAIGHVGEAGGKVTYTAIENKLETFKENNIELITLKKLNDLY